MDIINETRALIGFKPKKDITLVFTYKDVDRGFTNPGLLGLKINNRVVYFEVLSNQENRYLLGVILKSLRSVCAMETGNIADRLLLELGGLGFKMVEITNIRQREGTLLYDFDTSFPEYLPNPVGYKPSKILSATASYIKRTRFKVDLASMGEIKTEAFVNQSLVPETFISEQSIIKVTHGEHLRVMFNFDNQLWLTNISYNLNNMEKYIRFYEEMKKLAKQLADRHSNENIYHRIFSSLCILKINDIEFRPAMITQMTDTTLAINHRPYLFNDRSLSKEVYDTLIPVKDALSVLSNEVKYDRTNRE